ncbi:endonuclease/exonuclease/phosphatase family protein [Pseudomonas soli]|uniref:Endonuclease/exonuclease/phosphatase family protein n=1 Tax=Pseudomonas soli TaxID=1306993 RepID=A0ABU7GUW6_9PSED|nr:endonuclease/exonuclease/phosphatase family protein [Pseudomonas soli]MEE1882839.1 endonuclease/exonuclease/phosphatase family protein [Pseudomonas soli]
MPKATDATSDSNNRADCLTFAWWNTSLAPTGNSRNCQTLRGHAADIITYLLHEKNVDFIALGEMGDEDLTFLMSLPELEDFKSVSGFSKIKRSKFDTCYIFNPTKLSVVGTQNITYAHGSSTLKVAQKVEILEFSAPTSITVFASHWPSRLWCSENSTDRHALGLGLRREIDSAIAESASPPHIILMGDYNDEPFAASISEQLMATRDYKFVQKNSHLLYNPFWNCMGHGTSHSKPFAGSYYYKGGKYTKWHTFDQIIYSHAFVAAKAWRLCDSEAHLSDIPDLLEKLESKEIHIDHIPVLGKIVRTAQNV